MGAMAYEITSLTIVYSTVYSGADQRKHQSSASLAFVRGIHRWQVNSPHKGPVTRKMLPFDDVIMRFMLCYALLCFITCRCYPFSPGLFNLHQGNYIIAPVLVRKRSSTWVIYRLNLVASTMSLRLLWWPSTECTMRTNLQMVCRYSCMMFIVFCWE